jgi:competence protein ComEC
MFSPQNALSQSIQQESPHEFFVWNVGQGLWTTFVTKDACIHFDMGGEYAPWEQVTGVCKKRLNQVHLTHWDLDHISFIARISRQFKSVCLESPPLGMANQKKQDLLAKLIPCRPDLKPTSDQIPVRHLLSDLEESLKFEHSSNELSQVFQIGSISPIIIPGDSTIRKEKLWSKKLSSYGAWLLVLGHHGSRTSTSNELLGKLNFTRMAIASSRHARYGHPHREVIERLKMKGIALLKTEDWGTLRFQVPVRPPLTRGAMPTKQSRIVTERGPVSDKVYTRDSSYERRARKSRGRHRRSTL